MIWIAVKARRRAENEAVERSPRPRETWRANWLDFVCNRDAAVTERLLWLKHERDGFHAHLYDQLARHYREIGHESSERRVLIAKQWYRRKELPLLSKTWNWISCATLGYGYRSWRALGLFLVFFAAGTWYFGTHDSVFRHDYTVHPPKFRSWIYTLDLLLPVINLGQRENWVAKPGFPQTLATILIVMGWVLATTFLAGISGLVRRTNT